MKTWNEFLQTLPDKQRADLLQYMNLVGIRDGDSLFPLLVALEQYKVFLTDFPKELEKKVSSIIDKVTDGATKKAQTDLAKIVVESAQAIAGDVAKKKKIQWLSACIVVSFLCFAGFGWIIFKKAYNSGYEAGHAIGYDEIKDEKARDAWANTPEGRLAYEFAELKVLQPLAHCEIKGWEISGGICYPKGTPDGMYGFKIPKYSSGIKTKSK